MLACKKRLLNRATDYDDFCLQAAGKYFIRLLDKRQFMDPPGISPIKSILNYIKNTIYQLGVDFKQDNFCQIIDPANMREIDVDKLYEQERIKIQSPYNTTLSVRIEEDIRDIPNEIRQEINKLNIHDRLLQHRIYNSCVLSFINTVTLSNRDMRILNRRIERGQLDENYVISLYSKNTDDYIILWHLDDTYKNMIGLLVNKIKNRVSNVLQNNIKDVTLSEDTIRDIMWSSFKSTVGEEDYED